METKYFVMAALMLGLAACSNDEQTTEAIDDSEPVLAQFVGCIDKVQSRADGVVWDAGDAIGISGGEYINVKYLADTKGSDRHFSTETEGDEIYFKEKATINFIAYHPYNGMKGTPAGVISKTITAADQDGARRQQIDFMFGRGSGNKSASSVELSLQHKMSQLTLNFKSGGDDISKLSKFTIKDVKLSGTFDTETGSVEVTSSAANLEMNPTGITGKSYRKSLILYPQRFNAPIPIEVIWDGTAISGELNIAENKLMANSNYICDITVSKEGLEVNTIKGEWNDEETITDSQLANGFYVSLPVLPQNIEGITELKVSVDGETPEIIDGKCKVTAAQRLAISFKLDNGKRVKNFGGLVERGACIRSCSYSNGISSCVYFGFHSDIQVGDLNLETEDYTPASTSELKVGDYYYSDGTWSTTLDDSGTKECIGVVFKLGAGNGENGFMGLNKISGYVVALNNTVPGTTRSPFANNTLEDLEVGYDRYVGYSTTHQIANRPDFSENTYGACYSALNYNVSVPPYTSGWYVPALAEFLDMCDNRVAIDDKIKAAGGTVMKVSYGLYWSVSKLTRNDIRPAAYDFGDGSNKQGIERIHMGVDSNESYIRPILAF